MNDLSASWTQKLKTSGAERYVCSSSFDLPAGAIIKFHRGHTTPIDTSKTATTAAAIVQTIDSLGIIIPVLVLVLIPRAGRYIGR